MSEKLSLHPSELESQMMAPLDFVYSAVRDIHEGEELTIFYGKDWIYSWSMYLAQRVLWLEKKEMNPPVTDDEALKYKLEMPQFRIPIAAPDGLFPDSWIGVDCIGRHCDKAK